MSFVSKLSQHAVSTGAFHTVVLRQPYSFIALSISSFVSAINGLDFLFPRRVRLNPDRPTFG